MKIDRPRRGRSEFAAAAGRALRRAASKTAKMHGTPIYISKNGKVIAVRP